MLGGILLLNLAGVVALHRAWFGRRSFWPLASGLVGYNSGFLLGFLNWQIGSGLAMLFAAAWLTRRDQKQRLAIAHSTGTLYLTSRAQSDWMKRSGDDGCFGSGGGVWAGGCAFSPGGDGESFVG